ncbi:MAG: DsbC family protein [Gammaproteobacteria bacterium]|jgi:thiol:disulfide interchange protein DsbC|nr:DsbC family protein [Gammaproteobacteria bacterium]
MIRKFTFALALVSGGAVVQGCAAEEAAITHEPSAAVAAAVERIVPGEGTYQVRPAPIPGFQEVAYGAQILYISDDGRLALQGDIYDLEAERSLTDERRGELRLALLAGLDQDELIVFAPEGESKHVLHVFTDVDCTYCRRMHADIADYNRLGIEVRYLAFPRAGVDSPLYDKMVSVWCAEDRRAAMTQAKAGNTVPAANCDHPVREQIDLAASFGVTGTPTLVFPDGSSLPGYVPPERLAAFLDTQFPGR